MLREDQLPVDVDLLWYVIDSHRVYLLLCNIIVELWYPIVEPPWHFTSCERIKSFPRKSCILLNQQILLISAVYELLIWIATLPTLDTRDGVMAAWIQCSHYDDDLWLRLWARIYGNGGNMSTNRSANFLHSVVFSMLDVSNASYRYILASANSFLS